MGSAEAPIQWLLCYSLPANSMVAEFGPRMGTSGSALDRVAMCLTGRELLPIISNSDPPEYLAVNTKVKNQTWQIIFQR
jgi:hypothetical protein